MKTEFWYGNLQDNIKMNYMEVTSVRDRRPLQTHYCLIFSWTCTFCCQCELRTSNS